MFLPKWLSLLHFNFLTISGNITTLQNISSSRRNYPYSITLNKPDTKRTNIVWFHLDEISAAAAKLLQSCLTLCDPIDGSPPGSPVPGILQARTLEWVAISFSSAWKWKVKMKSLSRVQLFVTPWIAAHQAPPSMGFSRQEYWNGLPWNI